MTNQIAKADLGVRHHLDDPITRHMRTDCARLTIDQTVGQALASLRERPPESRIIYFYVVDSDGRLKGVVPTRRLLLSPLDRKIADIMVQSVIAIPTQATVLDACEFFIVHRLLAFPVVDQDQRLVGAVDVELYTTELNDVGQAERTDYLFQLIGVHLTETQQASPIESFRRRFPWLLCNLTGGILAAFLSGIFEAELQRAVALALFIPVVLALAESVSIQSVSLTLQVLVGQHLTITALWHKIRRETLTGLMLGTTCGALVAVVAYLWLGDPRIMWCLACGIAIGVGGAAVVGVALPNLLRMIERDPHVAAGPIALATADMITLLAYFNLASWLIR